MSCYAFTPLATDVARRLRTAELDDFGHPILRLVDDGIYPCRHCLREASAAGGTLLLSYQAPHPRSVYGHPTAIFLCAEDCPRFERPDEPPPIVANRQVSLRAFRADGLMVYDANALVEAGGDHDGAVRHIFERPDIAYINVHTTKAGCLLCHVARTGPTP
jgi:hypothetical protein